MKSMDEVRLIDLEEATLIREALLDYSRKYKAKDVGSKEYILCHQMIKDLGYFIYPPQDDDL